MERRRDSFKSCSRNRRDRSGGDGKESVSSREKERSLRFHVYAAAWPNNRHGPRRLGAAKTQPIVP